ncbi:MAG TPA: alginate export family protein [Gemmataceae bacterium]|jgi:hypothetical protein
MPFPRGGTPTWGLTLLVGALISGTCHPCLAAQPPDSPPKSKPASSTSESSTPDGLPASAGQTPVVGTSTSGGQMPAPDSPTSGRPAPAAEAPGALGPSGGEVGTPDVAPSRDGGTSQLPPDVEAPGALGPSGGDQQPSQAAGRDAPWWTRVPNAQPFPPLGNTIIPPRGPGYFTLWELLSGDRREKPPIFAYPRFAIIPWSFYNADWRYLDTADSSDRDLFDFLKRIRLGDDFMFTTGGEWRGRYANEVDSRLSGTDNTYYLSRTRVYGDFWYRDLFRIYGELISAQSFDQDLPPQPIDQYNPNFLNLFADARLAWIYDQPLWLRGGRQELLYGSERLISPLDWANTRRTFQGAKLFWQNEKFSLDGFVVQPVVASANSFASVNWQQVFSGVWGTYRPMRGEIVDLYYLDLQDLNLIYSGQNGVKGPQNVSTVGSRWYGNKNDWLWDAEGMIQFGRYSNQGIMANAYTMGGGHFFSKWFLNPSIWVYYDHASGQPGPPGTTGVHQTFNQLFPFGHYYFGMMDLVGRQNINDFHVDLAIYPVKWWTVWGQYHVLRLDSPFDALYNSAGVATLSDPTGKAGINVGEILTVINNFTIDLHSNIFVQYSHLYAGDFIHKAGNGRSPDELYLMYSFRW